MPPRLPSVIVVSVEEEVSTRRWGPPRRPGWRTWVWTLVAAVFAFSGAIGMVRLVAGIIAGDWGQAGSGLWALLVSGIVAIWCVDHTAWCPTSIDRLLSATIRRPPATSPP